nr:glycosyltransferase family 2 protein [Algoriphagus sp. NBT04N3]
MKVAVLLTCFNRVKTTIKCLTSLYQTIVPENIKLEVFLVDDASPDQTGKKVKELFPEVHVIKGNGQLFWNKGMRLAWESAVAHDKYDFFLWLNDDTFLKKDSLKNLLDDYVRMPTEGILVGNIQSELTRGFTFGGHEESGPKVPNGQPQKVKYCNGNLVLVPYSVYQKVGMLDETYTHLYGDMDYSLNVSKAGFDCYGSSKYLGYCEVNEVSYWGDQSLSLIKRIKLMHSPKGVDLMKCYYFKKKHGGQWTGIKTLIDGYAKALMPKAYREFKKSLKSAS